MARHKLILLVTILLGYCFRSEGQESATIYYDKSWKVVSEDSFTYYRKASLNYPELTLEGVVKDYHSNGKLVMVGNYKDGKKHGKFDFFNLEGTLLASIEFRNDQPDGLWNSFDSKRNILLSARIEEDRIQLLKLPKIGNIGLDDGKTRMIEYDVKTPEFIYRTRDAKVYGKLKGGLMVGKWKYTGKFGITLFSEKFKDGKFESGTIHVGPSKKAYEGVRLDKFIYHDEVLLKLKNTSRIRSGDKDSDLLSFPIIYFDNPEVASDWKKQRVERLRQPLHSLQFDTTSFVSTVDCGPVYTIVDTPPTFPGGMQGFYSFLGQNLKYPRQAQRMGVEGRVFVKFIVHPDGKVSNVEVAKGIGAGCDEEAARLIWQSSGKWIPGSQNGQKKCVALIQNILFKYSN